MMQMGDAAGLVERLQSAKTSIEEVTTIFKNPVRCAMVACLARRERELNLHARGGDRVLTSCMWLGGDDLCLRLHCRVPVPV